MPPAEVVCPARAGLAEGPTWHPGEQKLYWTDLVRGELHRTDPATGTDELVHAIGGMLGCFALREGGGYLLGTQDGLFRLLDGELTAVDAFLQDDPSRRLNDGKTDPQGRFWFGSNANDFTLAAGALHVLEPNGTLRTEVTGLALPNGLDWSPDGRTMYHADSIGESIDAYDFDPAAGSLSNRRRVVTLPDDTASPLGHTVFDGLATDAEGNLWVAIYGIGEVHCYSPAGAELEVVEVPALATTSVAFGGDGLRTLFVTTGSPGEELEAGSIFALEPGVAGQPTNLWKDPA